MARANYTLDQNNIPFVIDKSTGFTDFMKRTQNGSCTKIEVGAHNARTVLSHAQVLCLCEMLSKPACRIMSVKLVHKAIALKDLTLILHALQKNRKTKVTTLNLTNSDADDSIATELADLIRLNTSIKIINLNNCKMGVRGLNSLNAAFKDNFFLEECFIFGNPCLNGEGGRGGVNLTLYSYTKRNRENNSFSNIYSQALRSGEKSKLMVIGQGGAGKTSTVRALLNIPFNPNWDSTVGASLTKTSTSNWQEEAVASSDFNQVAAKVFSDAKKKLMEKNQEEMSGREKKRKKFLEEMKKYDSEAYQNRIKQERELQKENVEKMKQEGVQTDEKSVRAKPSGQQAVRTKPTTVTGGQNTTYAVDMEPEDPSKFKVKEPDESLLDPNEIARRYGQKMLATSVSEDAAEEETKVTFTIWDYGGQKVFYTLHHLFLTKYGVYLLVFDVNELIEIANGAKKKQVKFEVKPEAVEYLTFWVNSVVLHAPNAPLLLAGTHIDTPIRKLAKLKQRPAVIESFYDAVNTALIDVVGVKKHSRLVLCQTKQKKQRVFHPIDNRVGKGIPQLRSAIEDSAKRKFYVEQRIPLRWVLLCDALLEDVETNSKAWFDLSTVYEIGSKFQCSPDEIVQMLKLFNQLGVMVYLDSTNGLQNRVITDPQWLLDMLGRVIRDSTLHGAPSMVPKTMIKHWDFAVKTGLVSEALLEVMWENKQEKMKTNVSTLTFLLDLMKSSMLLSDWDYNTESVLDVNKYFLVPSLIPENLAQKGIDKTRLTKIKQVMGMFKSKKDVEQRSSLVMDFSEFFLPTGVFQRIICLLLVMLKTQNQKESSASRVNGAHEPILGQDFAWLSFKSQTGTVSTSSFHTELLLSSFEKDIIKLEVTEPSCASMLLKVVEAIIKKVKSEVMGGKLRIKLLLSKKAEIETTNVNDQKELSQQSTPVEYLALDEARKDKLLQNWFEEPKQQRSSKKKEQLTALDLDFDFTQL